MKLGLITSGFALVVVATMSGCAATAPAHTAVASAELHSADVTSAIEAPKVGKAFLAVSVNDDAEDVTDRTAAKNALAAPKDERPADCAHRNGFFGSIK